MSAPGIEQFGRLNVWGMLKGILNIRAGTFVFAGTPSNGAAGTFAGKAGPGAELIDSTTGIRYNQLGTLAAPLWTADNLVTGQVGLGSVGNAKVTYDFAVDGGATATIAPFASPTIPIGAIILGGVLEVVTIAASGGAPTISAGLGSGGQAASLVAAAAFNVAPWSTTGMKAIIPVFTAATYVKATAGAQLTFTIAGGTLTGGKWNLNLVYIQGA